MNSLEGFGMLAERLDCLSDSTISPHGPETNPHFSSVVCQYAARLNEQAGEMQDPR